jgi:hypothetical protein
MRRYLLYTLCIIGMYTHGFATTTQQADPLPGEQLFIKNCASCHSLENDGIGPRLGGVTGTRPQKELVAFISDPGKMIASGDERSINLFKRYKQQMPPFAQLGADNIKAIVTYIDAQTKLHHYQPLTVEKDDGPLSKRLLPAIKKSGLKVELQDFVKVPRSKIRSANKGIATLRPYPGADGTLFVSDQMGVIFRISHAKADTFLNITDYVKNFITDPGIATGLNSFAFHPDFLHNGLFYTTHAEKFLGKPAENNYPDSLKITTQWILTEWRVDDVKAKTFKGTHRELWRITEPSIAHGVQDINFIPGLKKADKNYGLLYIGIGDGGSNNIKHPELADNKRSFLGTIIRIDPLGHNSNNGKYGIPAGNPFAHDTDPQTRKEIYAYGFRNPHRMAWDITPTGIKMFVADIGESNIEEINLVEKGGNYGWSGREGDYAINTVQDLKKVYKLPESELNKYKRPFAMYDHNDGNAVSGGYVYKGPLVKLRNKYIFGDIVKGKLFYLDLNNNMADHTIHELTVMHNGHETTINNLINEKRADLRIGYDQYTGTLYIMTKADGVIRVITKAYY